MRQVHHASRGRLVGFPQQDVTDVLGGDQQPVGLELANLLAQDLGAAGGLGDGVDHDTALAGDRDAIAPIHGGLDPLVA